jgi:hypothetical protein
MSAKTIKVPFAFFAPRVLPLCGMPANLVPAFAVPLLEPDPPPEETPMTTATATITTRRAPPKIASRRLR